MAVMKRAKAPPGFDPGGASSSKSLTAMQRPPNGPAYTRAQWNRLHPGETAAQNSQSYGRAQSGQPTGFPKKGRGRAAKAVRRKALTGAKQTVPRFQPNRGKMPGDNFTPGGITPPALIAKGIRYS